MNTDIFNEQPAFPITGGFVHNYGMTLRDYFAAHVLQGMVAAPNVLIKGSPRNIVDTAYELADLMLAARTPVTEEQTVK